MSRSFPPTSPWLGAVLCLATACADSDSSGKRLVRSRLTFEQNAQGA
ncbi:MAG: hypothetical protein IPN34_16125 [Planctomycetes bacterium]|nr:hypothetical protein [Planctomycetota bacterium]